MITVGQQGRDPCLGHKLEAVPGGLILARLQTRGRVEIAWAWLWGKAKYPEANTHL